MFPIEEGRRWPHRRTQAYISESICRIQRTALFPAFQSVGSSASLHSSATVTQTLFWQFSETPRPSGVAGNCVTRMKFHQDGDFHRVPFSGIESHRAWSCTEKLSAMNFFGFIFSDAGSFISVGADRANGLFWIRCCRESPR